MTFHDFLPQLDEQGIVKMFSDKCAKVPKFCAFKTTGSENSWDFALLQKVSSLHTTCLPHRTCLT